MSDDFEQAVQRRMADIERNPLLVDAPKPVMRELVLSRLKMGGPLTVLYPEHRDWLIEALENKKVPADGKREERGKTMLYMTLLYNCLDEGIEHVHHGDDKDYADEAPFCATEVVSEALSRFGIFATPKHLSNKFYEIKGKYNPME